MIAGFVLLVLALSFFVIGLAWGGISTVVNSDGEMDRRVAFAWGFALGPIGVVIVAALRVRRPRNPIPAPF